MDQQAQTNEDYHKSHQHNYNFPLPIHTKTWCLYAKRRGKHSQNHDQQYHQPTLIASLRNIEQFFLYYTSIKLPSEFEVDTKVMIFEQHCKPSWQAWQHSGSLLLQFKDTKQNNEPQVLDQIWEYLILSMVGNQLDQDVIGLCLNKHQKQTLIEIWLHNLNRKVEIVEIIQRMINRDLQHVVRKLKKKIQFKYTEHKESMKKQSTMKGALSLKPQPRKGFE